MSPRFEWMGRMIYPVNGSSAEKILRRATRRHVPRDLRTRAGMRTEERHESKKRKESVYGTS